MRLYLGTHTTHAHNLDASPICCCCCCWPPMLSSESDTEDDILRIRRICMFYFDGRDARVSFRFAHLKEVIFIFSFFFFFTFRSSFNSAGSRLWSSDMLLMVSAAV